MPLLLSAPEMPDGLFRILPLKDFESAASLRRLVLRAFDLPKTINVLADYALRGV